MAFTSAESVKEYLKRIPKFQSTGSASAKFDLSRFRNFCSRMGNPEQTFPVIHVAGTNGKGSTCRILATVLQETGVKTGVYTSPHILEFNERFRINDEYISDQELLAFFEQYESDIEEYELSYFEISTAVAFWWFSKSNIDIGIIEVGLGGRLDATNVVNPLVSVITSISLDHTDILGNSIAEIAREKGGIIKENRPVVIGDLPEVAENKIGEIAEQKGSYVHTINKLRPTFLSPGHYQLTFDYDRIDINTNLAIPVQAKNIAIVWEVLQQIKGEFPVSREQFVAALRCVDLGFGRFEKLTDSQPWYFDGGHNVEAVKAMKQSIRAFDTIENATLVLSMLKDKLRPEVMNEFSEFKNIYYYQLNLERSATFDDINNWLSQVKTFPDDHNYSSFLDDFDSELVIFAGSFYFYEKVRGWVSSFVLNH